jgi:hypothetical protein
LIPGILFGKQKKFVYTSTENIMISFYWSRWCVSTKRATDYSGCSVPSARIKKRREVI